MQTFSTESSTNLSLQELLGIYVYGKKDTDTLHKIRNVFAAENEIRNLDSLQLKTLNGIGDQKAQRLLAGLELLKRINGEHSLNEAMKINCANDIVDFYTPMLSSLEQEEMHIMLLSRKNHIITEKMISKGTVDSTVVHPRDVFKWAIRYNASALIMIHNHPSGDPEPSKDDIETTKRIKSAGKLIGIDLLDHIIFGSSSRFISMKSLDII